MESFISQLNVIVNENILVQLSILVGVGLLLSAIATRFKQPLMIGYIATGIILGPSVLGMIKEDGAIASFSQLGIVVLLFTVGLSLSPKVFRQAGKASLITGIGQILLTAILGFLISTALNFSVITSIYIAIALTFSSTIIVIKVLSDKGENDTLVGRISVGILLIQDVAVMIILAAISSLSSKSAGGSINIIDLIIIASVLGLLVPISIHIMPKIMEKVAKSQEYLLMFSIGWCLLLSVVFHSLKASTEIGALLAGVTLSMSPYRHEIISKMKPLRDFFIFLFFIALGSQMVITNIGSSIPLIIALSLFVLIGKPFIVFFIMNRLGYTKKTSLETGLALAQVSEFSLILLAQGAKSGILSSEILSIVTIVSLASIAGSTYLMTYSEKIYEILSKIMPTIIKREKEIQQKIVKNNHEVIVFGYDKIGYSLLRSFKKMHTKFIVVDYNPEVIRYLESQKIHCIFGDAESTSFLEELELSTKKMIVSTIPVYEINSLILKVAKEYNKDAIVVLVSNSIEDSMKLYDQGASYVIIPRFLGGEHASNLIEKNEFDIDMFTKDRMNHIDQLGDRKAIKHFL